MRAFASLELDGELSELERSILEAHVEDCRACREFRAGVAGFTAALREAPPEAVTRSFRLPRRPSRLASFSTTAAAAAAAMVVAGLAAVLAPLAGEGGPRFAIENRTTAQSLSGVADERFPTVRPMDTRGAAPGSGMRVL